uniref:Ammonium_transp domain-containing protein n=1 Tax=Ascaris lumbricoides TaxID=6252 RepID=A0A0M3I9F9_ASCLU
MIIQACYQLAGLALVFASAIVSGAITGVILKLKIWNQVRDKELYADGDYFEVPEDFDFTTRIISKIDHIELAEHTTLTSKDNH